MSYALGDRLDRDEGNIKKLFIASVEATSDDANS